jgi:hypothetical protein
MHPCSCIQVNTSYAYGGFVARPISVSSTVGVRPGNHLCHPLDNEGDRPAIGARGPVAQVVYPNRFEIGLER